MNKQYNHQRQQRIQTLERQLAILVSQARNSPMNEQVRLHRVIKKKAQSYEVLTGHPYSITKKLNRQFNVKSGITQEVSAYFLHGHKQDSLNGKMARRLCLISNGCLKSCDF